MIDMYDEQLRTLANVQGFFSYTEESSFWSCRGSRRPIECYGDVRVPGSAQLTSLHCSRIISPASRKSKSQPKRPATQ